MNIDKYFHFQAINEIGRRTVQNKQKNIFQIQGKLFNFVFRFQPFGM